FGTLWGAFPEDLAAGPVNTGTLGRWWTPVTALFVPDSAVALVFSVVMSLTLLAYAERLLGSVRTVVILLVGGAVSILLGVGIEAPTVLWGSEWVPLAQFDLVLDPPLAIVVALFAASALAPALFRRRIRVIGFA